MKTFIALFALFALTSCSNISKQPLQTNKENQEQYLIFHARNHDFFGSYDFSIYCKDLSYMSWLPPNQDYAEYMLFNKIENEMFVTRRGYDFIRILEYIFKKYNLEKINIYSQCTLRSSYECLCEALAKSKLILHDETYETSETETTQTIKIKTKKGVVMKFELKQDDVICTCGEY